jgi:hypothetical protein
MSVIYVIKCLADIRGNEEVYKVGRTNQSELGRFNGYDKGSQLYYYERVGDCKYLEPLILQQLRAEHVNKRDRGLEYFEGNPREIIRTIRAVIEEFDNLGE